MTATDLRCSDVSALLGEPLAGTAPTDERWLFVEQPGPWGPKVELGVEGFEGHRVQWIRGVGRTQPDPDRPHTRRAFEVDLSAGVSVRVTTTTIDSTDDLAAATWAPYGEPLWLVCTNGRRDECCATRGRPVAAALAARWPQHTWETTHLSGHRFAPTLLALPSGYVLGRVPPERAVAAAEALLEGRLPLDLVRGRAGRTPGEQAAELHVRVEHDLSDLEDVQVVAGSAIAGSSDEVFTVLTPDGQQSVRLEPRTAEPRRLSCADVDGRPVASYVATGTG